MKAKNQKFLATGCAGLLAVSLTSVAVPAAHAEETKTPQSIAAAITAAEPTVLDNVAAVDTDPSRSLAINADIADSSVAVPADAAENLKMETRQDDTIEVLLPFGSEAERAETVQDGVVSYDNNNGSTTVPVVKDEGSVQITTVIDGPDSPTEYPYEVAVSGGSRLELVDGIVVIYNSEGDFAGGIAPAWAKDANGTDIPTEYRIEGTTLTQVVEHASAQAVAYPVVADPYLGIDLFSRTQRTTYNGDVRISAWKSTWGHTVHTPGTGQAIMLNNGWSELRDKQPLVTSKATLRHQYECHVGGGFYNIAGSWDLERFRPNRSNWIVGVASHRCNWG